MPLQLGIHEVNSQSDLHKLLETAQAEQKRAVVVQAFNGLAIRIMPQQGKFAALLNRLSNQTAREETRLNIFRNSLPIAHTAIGGQLAAANALQNGINPTQTPPIAIAEATDQVSKAAHDKEALKAFTHRLGEALMFDTFYVQSVRKNIEQYGLEEYLKGTETFPNPENISHVLRLAQKSGPYEYYLAGRLQAIGLIQDKEEMWGVTNQDITAWYDRNQKILNRPIEESHLIGEDLTPPNQTSSISTPPVINPAEAATTTKAETTKPSIQATTAAPTKPKNPYEEVAGEAFKKLFGNKQTFTNNKQEILSLIKESKILEKISQEDSARVTREIDAKLSKTGPENLKSALDSMLKIKQNIDSGFFIERQSSEYCAKHALASFFGRAAFKTEIEFMEAKEAHLKEQFKNNPEMFEFVPIEPLTDTDTLTVLLNKHIQSKPNEIPENMRGKEAFSIFITGQKQIRVPDPKDKNFMISVSIDTPEELARMQNLEKELMDKMNSAPVKSFIIGNTYHWYTVKQNADNDWIILDSQKHERQDRLDIKKLFDSVKGSSLNIIGVREPQGPWEMKNQLAA